MVNKLFLSIFQYDTPDDEQNSINDDEEDEDVDTTKSRNKRKRKDDSVR